MANDKHVSILEQGFGYWNKWRDDNPNIKVDLSMADLRGADLSGANFSEVNLEKADLRGADLKMTVFSRPISLISFLIS